MSDQLPSKEVLSAEEQEAKQAVMKYMSGEEGLAVFCERLREKGIELPKNTIWQHAKRKNVEAAVHATFSMLGGVPAMALWAHENPNLFYSAYIKLAPMESQITGAGNVFINTAVPESALDFVEIDSMGKIKEFKVSDE
ncbi:hypothetical protein LE191_04165 [Janthinobacterium sp. HSC-3S05]|uniref:hypothetical protein n=1 Tax=Janthinobacterium lividum TaxID=29581 RepID=UPI001CD82BCA|nr:hypothetical protein [Janthinobacterium lividum]MCA1859304.1 hypothetical protein [Janthinobacterium lividum]